MLSKKILDKPLRCSTCTHLREHHALKRDILTIDRLPSAGIVLVERVRRERVATRLERFPGRTEGEVEEVLVEVRQIGVGMRAKGGDRLVVFYEAFERDSMKMFECCRDGEGFEYVVGTGFGIRGWDIGLKGVRKGEKRKLVVPPGLAFGGRDICGKRYATVVFEVEIIRIDQC